MRRNWGAILAVTLVVVVAGGLVGFRIYRNKFHVALPDYPPVRSVAWLDQGWDQKQREWFYHADQGTQTFGIPYEWFVALEQPRLSLLGDVGRLSDAAYLDRFGFIPGNTKGGENQLPIGFARGALRNEGGTSSKASGEKQDGVMRRADTTPWLNPQTKQPMLRIGLTCAACHTGRLTYRGTSLLVDGGPALTDVGKFRQALGISVFFTRWVPGRFERFATNVLGEDAKPEAKKQLRDELDAVWAQFDKERKLDQRVARESVKEGYGRLDALNRIGNQVFSLSLDRDSNYFPTRAPVNYPHIWGTSWFDWVQYNASIEQPMVRNAGEALGVSAMINLTRPENGLYESVVEVTTLAKIEKQIAGDTQPSEENGFVGLRAPRWPSELFGAPVDGTLAKGAALYDELCKGCHLPPVGSKAFWSSEAWRTVKLNPDQRHLHVKPIGIEHIGTDPAQAASMKARTVDVPAILRIEATAFGPALGELVERAVNRWYDNEQPPVSPEKRVEMNGYRPNGIKDSLAYKARPLDGVWATPPFLHNGSVPNVYALLSPVSERPKSFDLGRRDYDPVCMGYQMVATPASDENLDERCLATNVPSDKLAFGGGFELNTTIAGNRNTGHEFNKGPVGNGILGRKLEPYERRALVEFLKSDCVNGRPTDRSACEVPAAPGSSR